MNESLRRPVETTGRLPTYLTGLAPRSPMFLALLATLSVQAPSAPHRVLIQDVTIVSPERKTRCSMAISFSKTTVSES